MDEENLNGGVQNDEELDSNIVTLKDESGKDVNFEFLDLIEYEGDNYVILLPVEPAEDGEADEVVILKEDKTTLNVEQGQESYVSVDDEEVLNKVFELFKEKFKDEFDFIDEDNAESTDSTDNQDNNN